MTKQLNILHIGKYYPPYHGGIENFLSDLAEAQVAVGHRVTVLCHHHKRALKTTREARNGVKVIRARNLGNIAYAPFSPGFTRAVMSLEKTNSHDLIHVHLPNLSALFLTSCTALPPIVIHWHADVVSAPGMSSLRLLYPFYGILEKKFLARASKIIVTSTDYLETSKPLTPYSKRCRVVPLGLNPRRMTAPCSIRRFGHGCVDSGRPSSPSGIQDALDGIRYPTGPFNGFEEQKTLWDRISGVRCLAVAVGRFTIYKGFDLLVRAASLVPEVTFVIVGDGPLRKRIISLRRHLGVERNVLLPGMLSDRELHLLLGLSDMVILPSIERTEAFGLVLLEAMYYAKPLITTRVPGSGMNMVNTHDETGLVVPPNDIQSLAQAIDRLYSHSLLKDTMGRNAQRRFEEKFTISEVANQIDLVYSER